MKDFLLLLLLLLLFTFRSMHSPSIWWYYLFGGDCCSCSCCSFFFFLFGEMYILQFTMIWHLYFVKINRGSETFYYYCFFFYGPKYMLAGWPGLAWLAQVFIGNLLIFIWVVYMDIYLFLLRHYEVAQINKKNSDIHPLCSFRFVSFVFFFFRFLFRSCSLYYRK